MSPVILHPRPRTNVLWWRILYQPPNHFTCLWYFPSQIQLSQSQWIYLSNIVNKLCNSTSRILPWLSRMWGTIPKLLNMAYVSHCDLALVPLKLLLLYYIHKRHWTPCGYCTQRPLFAFLLLFSLFLTWNVFFHHPPHFAILILEEWLQVLPLRKSLQFHLPCPPDPF